MADRIEQEGDINNLVTNPKDSTINFITNVTTSSEDTSDNKINNYTNPFRLNIVFFLIVLLLTSLVFLITTLFLKVRCTKGIIEEVCKEANSSPTVFIIQFVVIIFLMLFVGINSIKDALNRFSKLNNLVRNSFHQFLQGLVALWSSWALLYLIISVFLIFKDYIEPFNFALQITVDFLNITNSLTFFFLFLVLDIESVPAEGEENRENRNEKKRDAKFKQHLNWLLVICGIVFIITVFSRFYESTSIGFLIYASGLLVALSMAYVFGRLDSHYMRVKRWQLAPLYIYAAIQPLGIPMINFHETNSNQIIPYQEHFFVAVTALKLFFFIIIDRWLSHGYFELYFDRGVKGIEDKRSNKFD